ncbi:FAD-binding protein [Achromobacter xylosoxidans]
MQTPWARFIQRLTLLCQGAVRDLGEAGADGPRGWLAPAREGDLAHARALCAEYGVALALDGAEGAAVGPCLRVDPANLSGLARLAGDTPRWRAQPGVPLAVLAQAGLRQFDGLPGAMTLAEWLAAPAAWPAGRCAQSGVLAADVVLADGVEETLGPFGESDERPLRSATLQRLVPALFQLSTGPDAAACAVGGAWAGRYRLDALHAGARHGQPGASAAGARRHAGLGAGGAAQYRAGDREAAGGDAPPLDDAAREAGRRLDARIKALFDPDGRFPLLAFAQ